MELVNLRNQVIHLENYEDKWNNLREVLNKVLDDLHKLFVQALNQALKKWFDEVIEIMKVVEVKISMKQLSESPHYIDYSKKILEPVRSGLDTSWIIQMLIKPEKYVMKSLNMEDHEEMKLVKKLQEDPFEPKMVFEKLRRQLAKVKEEQKQQRAIPEAQIKKIEVLEMRVKQHREENLAEQ